MSGQFYDNADRRVYRFPAETLSAAATVGTFQGPPGKQGRVRGIDFAITTATTGAASLVSVGNAAAVLPAQVSVPVGAIGVIGQMTAAQIKAAGADEVVGANDVILDADTVVNVATDGGSTVGAADLTVTVDWF